MKCAICKSGETHKGEVTITLERGDTTLSFKKVPAEVCHNCGEEYVDEETIALLLKDAEMEVLAGTRVNIKEFTAA